MGARGMSGAFDGMDSPSVFSLPIAVTLSGMLSTGGRDYEGRAFMAKVGCTF